RALRRERERRRSRAGLASDAGLAPTLLTVLEALLAAHGTVSESLVRDVGWHLLDAGRRLERAHRVVATLAATLATRHEPAVEELVVTSVLAAHESGLTFPPRRDGRGSRAPAPRPRQSAITGVPARPAGRPSRESAGRHGRRGAGPTAGRPRRRRRRVGHQSGGHLRHGGRAL